MTRFLANLRPNGEGIFQIGQENENYGDLMRSGFAEHAENVCTVGVDCTAEAFPNRMCMPGKANPSYEDQSVEKLTIIFDLERDYDNIVLRLARGGAKTSAISLDSAQPALVTSAMLNSAGNFVVGFYDLALGGLGKGTHTLEFSATDGNGRFSWDALLLIAVSADDWAPTLARRQIIADR